MSTTSKIKTAFLGIAATLALTAGAQAQSSTTPTIGYYKQTFGEPGPYAISVGFVRKTEFQGQSSVVPTVAAGVMTVTQTGAGWTPGAFDTFAVGSSHYIEVLSNPGSPSHTGMILDISGNTDSALSVIVPTGFTPASGFTYAIRKHVTLGSLLPAASGVSEADGDGAILLDAVGNIVNATYLGAGNWDNLEDPGNSLNDFVIYPGQGIVFFPAGSGRTITIGGGDVSYVKSGPTVVSAPISVPILVGLVNPLVSSGPSDPIHLTTGRNTLADMGLVAGLSEADADLLQVFSFDGALSTLFAAGKVGSDLINFDPAANINNENIANGQSVLILTGADKTISLPQRH